MSYYTTPPAPPADDQVVKAVALMDEAARLYKVMVEAHHRRYNHKFGDGRPGSYEDAWRAYDKVDKRVKRLRAAVRNAAIAYRSERCPADTSKAVAKVVGS